jgi:hypothetical protein
MRRNKKIEAIDGNPAFRAVRYYSEYVELLNYHIVSMTPFDLITISLDEVLFREMNYDMYSLYQI